MAGIKELTEKCRQGPLILQKSTLLKIQGDGSIQAGESDLIDEQAKTEKKSSRVKTERSVGSSLKSRVKYASKLSGGQQQPRGSLGRVKEIRDVLFHSQDKTSNHNAKALNAIFYGVDQDRFKLISTCESAKDAWEILSTTYEGTARVRLSKLQLFNHKFKNLQMGEDETIAKYDARIRDIANERFTLGRKIPEAEQVQKVLRSLTKKFAVKVAAIKEFKDLDTLKYDDLMGSPRSYEMNIEAKKK
ncbi:hypothetical protein H6P81_016187 [Aristolochia fimbriata]|uniref:Gag-pol polyprotein n=1 Tax=Aristolochia fimbriata TaxID=158543 RepID=A0AAV7E7M3_ARIFI|nr:hypothetical protein H6P81_016187 [Aristolochia fimbriata]